MRLVRRILRVSARGNLREPLPCSELRSFRVPVVLTLALAGTLAVCVCAAAVWNNPEFVLLTSAPVQFRDLFGLLAPLVLILLAAVYTCSVTCRNVRIRELVRDRTAELTAANQRLSREIQERQQVEKQLAVARDSAIQASNLKLQFLANTSHEIRTPLNAVIGAACLLQATELSGEQRELVNTLRDSGKILLALINDLLDFSKIEAGRLTLQKTDFPVVETVESAGEIAAGLAHAKGLELNIDINAKIPGSLRGDPVRVRQVLLNLLGNAVKFTEKGEVLLKAILVQDDGRTSVIRFEVADTGIGIPPAIRDRLFNAFTQADGTSTRRHGGAGLGLAISKELVGLLGGQIGFESTPGVGSRFWFSAPMERCSRSLENGSSKTRCLEGVPVLLVDPHASRSAILHRYAAHTGATVTVAATPEEALRTIRECRVLIVAPPPGHRHVQEEWREILESGFSDGVGVVYIGAPPPSPTNRPGGQPLLVVPTPVRRAELISTLEAALGNPLPPSYQILPCGARPAQIDLPTGTTSVLLAEDNRMNQKVVGRLLEKLGCQVSVAETGLAAVELASRQPFDLIVMDCQMPQMDGFEATRRIRTLDGAAARTPIVALTANAFAGDRERCLDSGMDDYLSKPVQPEALRAALCQWVSPTASGTIHQTAAGKSTALDFSETAANSYQEA